MISPNSSLTGVPSILSISKPTVSSCIDYGGGRGGKYARIKILHTRLRMIRYDVAEGVGGIIKNNIGTYLSRIILIWK